jgi:hypothetical protein
MAFKAICIILVIAVLLEDGSSIKKTEEEKKEDEELAKAVNKTLAEEKKREEDEKKKRGEKKKTTDEVKDDKEKRTDTGKQVGQGEDCPSCNFTCPVVTPCQPCRKCEDPVTCLDPVECPPCEDCLPCRECGPCPVRPCKPCKECSECPEVRPCSPCGPGSVGNHTSVDQPPTVDCSEVATMSVPVALVVGALTGGLATGLVTFIGLVLRYASPFVSGFLFVATIIIIWYLCSHHPETARELGGRAATLLREAAAALSHRIVEAIRHHNEQVSFPVLIPPFLLPDLSSLFI